MPGSSARGIWALAGICLSIATTGFAGDMHVLFTRLLQEYSENGLLDYEGFAADPSFAEYLGMLASTSPESLATREERLALWVNAYNAYTIKLIIDKSPLESIRDIELGLPILFGPWSIAFANVGGNEYTLNAIEHDIIREEFKDARIHFALVCAARSFPRLRREDYEGAMLNRQLDDDARRFINDDSLNHFDARKRKISLSMIFDWYSADFEEDGGSLRLFLTKYLDSAEARELLWSDEVEIGHLPYDWSLNRK